MPQFNAPHQLPVCNMLSGRVSDVPNLLSARKYDDAADKLLKFKNLQPVGSSTAEAANELNNLLSIIIGNAELLKELPGNSERVEYLSNYILNAADRGVILAQKLQSLGRH